jgi:L-rhamnose isomerase
MASELAAVARSYELAKEIYALSGVDTDRAVRLLANVPLSLHCWQGDDVGGFEPSAGGAGGGTLTTGNYPGKARNADELRQDLALAMSLIPGRHRVNLHAIYAETGGVRVERDALAPEHFSRWVDWAKQQHAALDFNPTFFSHPLAAGNFTLSSADAGIRNFWVRHGIACRRIGASFGEALGSPCITNVWIPDGYKDMPADRLSPRRRLRESLDAIFAESISETLHLDALESKLFGIGVESYTVGSHEFYMGYAIEKRKLLTLDSGHFHPTESIADKVSSMLLYVPALLLHVSRGVRWDSDHVVVLSDDLRELAAEIVRGDFLSRVHIGLDYFDASINRIAAWVIGARSMYKSLLLALLEPTETLRLAESRGDYAARLALLEETKTLPFGAVWDYFCEQQSVPVGPAWLSEVQAYERDVLSRR